MTGKSDKAAGAGSSKGFTIKAVHWEDDDDDRGKSDTEGTQETPCKGSSNKKTSGEDAPATANEATSKTESKEMGASEEDSDLQPLMQGWYLHRNSRPMNSLNYQSYHPWYPTFQPQGPNNVTYIGQASPQPAPVFVQQPPVYMGMGMNPYQSPYQNPYGPPQVIRAPGHPGGGPPMLARPPGTPGMNGPPNGASGFYGGGQLGPTFYPGAQLPPDITGIGRTAGEISVEQAQIAEQQNLTKPQDFKPADDDPSRYYWMRELDGEWTQRNRLTIDKLDCRWYLHEAGYFYAVRLAD